MRILLFEPGDGVLVLELVVEHCKFKAFSMGLRSCENSRHLIISKVYLARKSLTFSTLRNLNPVDLDKGEQMLLEFLVVNMLVHNELPGGKGRSHIARLSPESVKIGNERLEAGVYNSNFILLMVI